MARDADIEKWREWYHQALFMTDEGEKKRVVESILSNLKGRGVIGDYRVDHLGEMTIWHDYMMRDGEAADRETAERSLRRRVEESLSDLLYIFHADTFDLQEESYNEVFGERYYSVKVPL